MEYQNLIHRSVVVGFALITYVKLRELSGMELEVDSLIK